MTRIITFIGLVALCASCKTQSEAARLNLCAQDKSQVKKIIATQLHIKEQSIGWPDSLKSLGADNLDHIIIIMEVEKAYDVLISNDTADSLLTVQDIHDYVCIDTP